MTPEQVRELVLRHVAAAVSRIDRQALTEAHPGLMSRDLDEAEQVIESIAVDLRRQAKWISRAGRHADRRRGT